MLRWPHGGHGDCASARTGYGVTAVHRQRRLRAGVPGLPARHGTVPSVGPAGWDARRRAIHCVAAPPEVLSLRSLYSGAMEGAPSVRRKRESRKRKFSTIMRSPQHTGGRSMPGDHAPPQGGATGAVLGVLLRIYGFTPLPPHPTLRPGHAYLRIKLPPAWCRSPSAGRRGGGRQPGTGVGKPAVAN